MGPIAMVPVVEYGRRGYRFTGRLRLDGLLLAGEGIETRQPVVAPTGFEPVFQSQAVGVADPRNQFRVTCWVISQ